MGQGSVFGGYVVPVASPNENSGADDGLDIPRRALDRFVDYFMMDMPLLTFPKARGQTCLD